MDRAARLRSRANYNLQMKSSSLYFLNDISNFNSTENLNSEVSNWRDSYTFNPMILGRGHFSKVYKAKCLKTGKYVAVKIIRRRRLGVDKLEEIMKEIDMMQLFNKTTNGAFIQLVKYHVSNTEVAVLIEFAAGGSIYNVIRDSENGLPETYSRIILSKIISAIGIMHSHNIVHLDIKADNILLRHPYPSTDVALADFGLAKKLSKTKVHKEMIGTPDYIAPEVSNYDNISTKSDMWSVGVLTYFILTNISPFCADTKEETLSRVTKAQFDYRGVLENDSLYLARDFIDKLLVKNPEKRFNADQCLNHEFLSSVSFVEYPQSMQSPEKALPSINIADDEYIPQVRENTNYQVRALVISQYDIGSSHLHDSPDNLLQLNSATCLSNVDLCYGSLGDILNEENNRSPPPDEEMKQDSCPSEEEAENEDEVEINSTPEVDEIIENDFDAVHMDVEPDNENVMNDEHDSISDKLDPPEQVILESPECTKQSSFYSSGKHNEKSTTSLSEMTSSWNDTTHNGDVSSESESDDHDIEPVSSPEYPRSKQVTGPKLNGYDSKYKKDNEAHESFVRMKIYDSRHMRESVETSKLKNNSFRYSRDNLVGIGQSMEDLNEDFSSYSNGPVEVSHDYNTLPFRRLSVNLKKRPLTRSLKRDCDKPADSLNRRSQIITRLDDFDPSSSYSLYLSKSQNTLGVGPAEGVKETKNSYKLSNLLRPKRQKKNDKKHCIIS